MSAASPITRQTVGQTFTVALCVLGMGVVVQLGAVGWAFIARNHAQPDLGDLPTMARLTSPVGMRPDFGGTPFDQTPEQPPTELTTDPNAAELPRKPVPVPAGGQKAADAVPQTRFDELIQQGRQLRDRGDTGNALVKFREAGAMDPRNPIAIAELAATFEKMRLLDRSSEQWKRIYEMGDAAGIYFSLAESKLKETQARAILEAMPPGTGGPAPDTTVMIEGIAPGALLGMGKIRTEEQSDADSQKKFTLHIPVRARPRAKVEVHDLVIHVMFYDKVDGKNVVQTSANVGSKWITSPVDWAESDTEELAVEYQLPRPEPGRVKRETREFFGYLVRIYYKQQLQASFAEPERLAQQYPAPAILPKNNEP